MALADEGSTRNLPATLLVIAAVLLIARLALAVYESYHPPKRPDLVSWRTMPVALEESRRRHLPILYEAMADWCRPCKEIQREVFADRNAALLINTSFISVRIDQKKNAIELKKLSETYGTIGFPTLLVVDEKGKRIGSLVGYPGKRRTLKFLSDTAMKQRSYSIPAAR